MSKKMFDFVLGNPPYQLEQESQEFEESKKNFAPPIYDKFIDASRSVATCVELIHPARFLFNAGGTSKEWNEKILNDNHFKVLKYEPDSLKIFPGLIKPIKGGIAITCIDENKINNVIGVFSQYEEMNKIIQKVIHKENYDSLSTIVYSRTSYRLTKKLHLDFPDAINKLSKGHAYDMSSNIFDRLPNIFCDSKPENGEYAKILGRSSNKRVYKYINREYINDVENFEYYKLLVPQANGKGTFGETISGIVIAEPYTGSTETFISIGKFDKKYKAENLFKYISSKFARCMLSVLKVTQNGNKPVWKYVPLQDFTDDSDIDWSKSIPEIDQQLYKKYGLSDEEIDFIETHVKEMK